MRAAALLLGLTFIVVASLEAQSGKVSGTLVVNGKKLAVQEITAVTYDTPSPGRLVSVLVSDKPPNPKTFQEYTRIGPGERYVAGMITGAWVTMHIDKEFSGFQFTFDEKRNLILNDVMIGARDDNFSILEDELILELTSVTPRAVGRLRTKQPIVDLGSQKVGIDLTFDVPVTAVGK
jgi:hypothetical protein